MGRPPAGDPQLLGLGWAGRGGARGCGAPGVLRVWGPQGQDGESGGRGGGQPVGCSQWVGGTRRGGGVCGQCSAVPAGESRGSRGRGLLLLLGPAFPVVLAPVHGLGLRLPARQVCVQQLRPRDRGQIPPQGRTGGHASPKGSQPQALGTSVPPRVNQGSVDPLGKEAHLQGPPGAGNDFGFPCCKICAEPRSAV